MAEGMRALEPLHLSSELEAFYNDQASSGTGQRRGPNTSWHLLYIFLVTAGWWDTKIISCTGRAGVGGPL